MREARKHSPPLTLILLAAAAVASSVSAVTWQTAANNPTQDFVALDYPLVFVTADIIESMSGGVLTGQYNIGTDVLSATRPSAGNELWVLYPGGQVKKLFPLACHEGQTEVNPENGLTYSMIDTPSGQLSKGSVVEPNVSEDGTKVYFSYFHDATDNITSGQGSLSKRGADMYAMDLEPLLDLVYCTAPCAIQVNPSGCGPRQGLGNLDLPVKRLTFRDYQPGMSKQAVSDRVKGAMNPTMASNQPANGFPGEAGTVFLHPTEMRTNDGLKLVYVSNERRLENSNGGMDKPNYNTNLHIADLEADGSLGMRRQFQYFTTTAALSPTPMRNGVSFAYQSTTADARNWHIQSSDSVGQWNTLLGYGTNQDLFHLGTFCVDTLGDTIGNGSPGDYFLGVRYYNVNNEGFGALWKIDMAQVGTNNYLARDPSGFGVEVMQTGSRQISLGVEGGDRPSGTLNGNFIGKITTPRCGRANELLMTYTPTNANGKPGTNPLHIYHGHIVYRFGFDDFNPSEPYNPVTNDGLRTVIDDSDDDVNLVWPSPVIPWSERSGDTKQQFTKTIIDKKSKVLPGKPFAQVGTSALYHTDRKPYDCFLGFTSSGKPYNPHTYSLNEQDNVIANYDGMTYVPDPSDFCKGLDLAAGQDLILGVAVNLTSNETDLNYNARGYETDGEGPDRFKEVAKLLGVYDVRSQTDQSFQALIPSHSPFEFHLIDKRYGLRLLDVRSWHSLYPQQTATNCGGCHQHDELEVPIDFAGTVAAGQPPLDMVTGTPRVSYDASCNPVVTTSANPTEIYPEWKADIWPEFNTYCGKCHSPGGSMPSAAAMAELTFTNESEAFIELESKRWAHSPSGALGSQAFWNARGQRTDGRSDAIYGANYSFSSAHSPSVNHNLCDDATEAAWVHRFGQWIDNHMPRDSGVNCNSTAPDGKCGAHFDRFHPSVDVALSSKFCSLGALRVGYWDDSGHLSSVETFRNGASINTFSGANGHHKIGSLSLALADRVKVVAEDDAGNRQIYEKTVRQMHKDCRVRYPKFIQVDPIPHLPLP